VVDRHVANDDVRFEDKAEHVLANIAGLDDLSRCAASEPGGFQRRLDELGAHAFEIDLFSLAVLLLVERTNNKCALHDGSPPFRACLINARHIHSLKSGGAFDLQMPLSL